MFPQTKVNAVLTKLTKNYIIVKEIKMGGLCIVLNEVYCFFKFCGFYNYTTLYIFLQEGENMDKIDYKLITLLHENARMPLKQLAERVFLSSPATAARLERLEKSGIISGYSVKVDHKLLGYPITAFINLEVQPAQKACFYPFITKHPNVLECNCVTGHYSMLIKVAFQSTEALDVFIGQLQTFGSTQTQIVFSTAKLENGVDLENIIEGNYPEVPEIK